MLFFLFLFLLSALSHFYTVRNGLFFNAIFFALKYIWKYLNVVFMDAWPMYLATFSIGTPLCNIITAYVCLIVWLCIYRLIVFAFLGPHFLHSYVNLSKSRLYVLLHTDPDKCYFLALFISIFCYKSRNYYL